MDSNKNPKIMDKAMVEWKLHDAPIHKLSCRKPIILRLCVLSMPPGYLNFPTSFPLQRFK